MNRARFFVPILAAFVLVGVTLGVAPQAAQAASCVRISTGHFDSPGNDNYMPQLNGEYIKIRNYCTTAKYLTGWHVNDYGTKHRYAFPSGFKLNAGVTVTLHSGRGTRSATHLYWNRSYGAVWNNTPPERAYLRNAAGTLVSSWSSY
jgi:hypothetical protein